MGKNRSKRAKSNAAHLQPKRRESDTFVAENEELRSETRDGLTVSIEGGMNTDLPSRLAKKDEELVQKLWDCIKEKKQKKKRKLQNNKKWEPTPAQHQCWPVLWNENVALNVIGIAPTGSGKTLAYGLPMVVRAAHYCHDGVYGLVLVPTRELAIQVSAELKVVCKAVRKKSSESPVARMLPIYGGVDKEEQLSSLLDNPESITLVTSTPGRLLDLLEDSHGAESQNCALSSLFSNVRFVVLDEADRMAINKDIALQVDSILKIVASPTSVVKRTTCLFSATHPEQAQEQWNQWVGVPRVCIKVDTITVGSTTRGHETTLPISTSTPVKNAKYSKEEQNGGKLQQHYVKTTQLENNQNNPQDSDERKRNALDLAKIPSHVTQTLHVCSAHKKPRKLLTTLKQIRTRETKQGKTRQPGLCIVFFARIKTLLYIRKLLAQEGYKTAEIHSHRNQSVRERALSDFKAGKVTMLLATDIAARGIHVNNVEHVINYDFPGSLEQYVHRCGRAGRNQLSTNNAVTDTSKATKADSSATVYSFFTRELAPMAKDVLALLKASDAWIDPNLVGLLGNKSDKAKETPTQKRKRRRTAESVQVTEANGNKTKMVMKQQGMPTDAIADSHMDSDDYQFAFLSANRVVLKRASHVSDASDSDSG